MAALEGQPCLRVGRQHERGWGWEGGETRQIDFQEGSTHQGNAVCIMIESCSLLRIIILLQDA